MLGNFLAGIFITRSEERRAKAQAQLDKAIADQKAQFHRDMCHDGFGDPIMVFSAKHPEGVPKCPCCGRA